MSDQLGIEVILLAAASAGKGIDIATWLAAPEDGKLNISEFKDRWETLALAVSLNEEWEVKRELQYATSKESIALIQKICYIGNDYGGNALIDVNKFIALCETGIENYLYELSEGNRVYLIIILQVT